MPSPLLHDTSFDMEYATKEAREATFAPPTKRSKAGWPHRTPTPTALAKAGFYYKPSPHSNDNTVCFLCDRNLDGWEAEDDPVQEHLKHAEDCGWALLMKVETAIEHDTSSMDDPTGEALVNARKATFNVGWPHEGKRGWTCKIEKMVEAGWYFAPTSGSDDYVSCAYCKLSLDGWEPKDNPFDEHYSRSPSCPFFVFAGTTAPSKRPKSKKGRASRASRTSKASARLSTQSNATVQSETNTIPDLDESIDSSMVSMMSTASTATTKGKRKAGTTRSKTTKSKRAKTTKAKKDDESNPEPPSEATVTVAYPELQLQPEDSQALGTQPISQREDSPRENNYQKENPKPLTGPPEVQSPTIPVLAESPVPARPQRTEINPARKSIPKQQIKNTTPSPRSSPSQPSDVGNAPPSTRPKSVRPPLPPTGTVPPKWNAVDIDMVFDLIASNTTPEVEISDGEGQMTVQEWIKHIANKAEDELRTEGERVVGIFETEGQKALTVLESIVCL